MIPEGYVLAFSFAAGEFLDESLGELSAEYGKDLQFFTKGMEVKNDSSKYPFEWWAPKETVDELNKLKDASKKDKQIKLYSDLVKKLEEKCEVQKEYIDLLKKNLEQSQTIIGRLKVLFAFCRPFMGWIIARREGIFQVVENLEIK